jgi:HEAT repeat protein
VAALGLIALLAPERGGAQPVEEPAAAPAAPAIAKLARDLGGEDDEAAVAAARKLGDLGVAAPLVSVLSVGLRPAVAAEALGALARTKDGRAFQVFSSYSGNINLPVRVAAVKGLGRLTEPQAIELLLARLGDGHPQVRGAAAEALAARKVTRAEERLFKLVARNDAAAAAPLGVLMAPSAVPRLAELKGRIDDNVLATALGEFVKRADVPDRLRVDVIRTLGRLPGAIATAALVEYIAGVPEREQRPSRDEAQKLLDQRGAR